MSKYMEERVENYLSLNRKGLEQQEFGDLLSKIQSAANLVQRQGAEDALNDWLDELPVAITSEPPSKLEEFADSMQEKVLTTLREIYKQQKTNPANQGPENIMRTVVLGNIPHYPKSGSGMGSKFDGLDVLHTISLEEQRKALDLALDGSGDN